MGSVIPRKRADGTIGYQGHVVVWRDGKPARRETKTFDRKAAAHAWIAKRETELKAPGGLDQVDDPPLGDVIDRYIKESKRSLGRTKTQVLRTLKTMSLAEQRCSTIRSADIVALAQELGRGRAPQTVSNYLSHLGAVFAIARPAWSYPLEQGAMKDAFTVTRRLGLTGNTRARERRPTLGELDTILTHFVERSQRRPDAAPMQRIVGFALFSTRRLEEITRILWSDLDVEGRRILVRDMKNPGEKIGNDTWCDLPPEALAIARAMPRRAHQIFPFSTDAISAAFTRSGPLLGIEDLHFHDLRHEGISRLFELGWNIPHVAAISGHRSWTSLKRYTHLRQTGDKYAGWSWLATLTTPPEALMRPSAVDRRGRGAAPGAAHPARRRR